MSIWERVFINHCTCVRVIEACVSVTTVAATVFIQGTKVRHHRLPCADTFEFDSWISLERYAVICLKVVDLAKILILPILE